MSDAKEHPDKHLIDVLTMWLPTWDRLSMPSLIEQVKEAIRHDEEAHRLFCKEIVRKKIEAEGKPVEGSEFNNKP